MLCLKLSEEKLCFVPQMNLGDECEDGSHEGKAQFRFLAVSRDVSKRLVGGLESRLPTSGAKVLITLPHKGSILKLTHSLEAKTALQLAPTEGLHMESHKLGCRSSQNQHSQRELVNRLMKGGKKVWPH